MSQVVRSGIKEKERKGDMWAYMETFVESRANKSSSTLLNPYIQY